MDDDPKIQATAETDAARERQWSPISDADLELLLAEADREDQLLTTPRSASEPREALDAQILGGLVSP
jgi:hypothetical protein